MTTPTLRENKFDWPLCYEAENHLQALIDGFAAKNHFARRLAERMAGETGTLLIDWVDHLVVGPAEVEALRQARFVDDPMGEAPGQWQALWHPEAMLPRILVDPTAPPTAGRVSVLALRCDSVQDFMVAHRLSGEPDGPPLSRFRRLLAAEESGTRLDAIERRGYRGYLPGHREGQTDRLLKATELWRTRPRHLSSDALGYERTLALLDRLVDSVGPNLACHIVFSEERAYWQSRNRAAQVQKARQDRLGLGWANHDHHTFRCSREHFVDLMRAHEKLGFERRERFYAGAQAGWGAQILEHPVEGIVTFCDVDLQPEETAIDFSRRPLPPAKELGTIGLWVGLNGESLLGAGMHHLECRFDYQRLRGQLSELGVKTMNPFSDFPFLKQAFTEGERWPVERARAERLLQAGLIDQAQFEKFISEGAIGSHLENLQRKGGFKGFNQTAVSVIIQATDPRRQPA